MSDPSESFLPGSGDEVSTSTGDQPSRSRNADRVLGVLSLLFGIWYTVQARSFDGTAFASGPVGPKSLPTAIGILFGLVSLYLIFKPDPSPDWSSPRILWRPALVVVSSYVYGQVLESIGFIASSVAMILVVGWMFGGKPGKLLPLGFVFSVVTAFIFNNLLELRLPVGWWGGL